MKRDMNLIRQILFAVEASQNDPRGWAPLQFDGYDSVLVSYHVYLLYGAGFVEAENCSSSAGYEWQAKCLTWQGQEFLAAIRNDVVWKKIIQKTSAEAVTLTFDILKELGTAYLKELVGL